MPAILGPILGFRGADDTTWRVSALWVLPARDAAPKPNASGAVLAIAPAVALATNAERTAWRVDLSVTRPNKSEVYVDYALPGAAKNWFAVPSAGLPLQTGFASCNGFADPKYKKKVAGPRNARWEHLLGKHKKHPLHVLLLGGDQVYGDSIWRACDLDWLAKWLDLGAKKKAEFSPTPEQRKAVAKFYFDLYCERWQQEGVKDVLAGVPTLMMWDDHDIFDGWGSHDEPLQNTLVFKAIFAEADAAFRVFQLQVKPGEAPPGSIAGAALSYAQRVNEIAIVVLDLRSERTPEQVLAPKSWERVLAAIDLAAAAGPKHLFVVSGPPVLFPSASTFEKVIDAIPGEQDVEDDLRDRWGSKPHVKARETLVQRLLRAAAANRVRVTLLSGDVHMAALGMIKSTRQPAAPPDAHIIYNLVSSPIVHAPPSKLAIFALKLLDKELEIGRDIDAKMLKLPGADARYLAQRNWLRLRGDALGVVNAEWWVESKDPAKDVMYAKPINPVA